MALLEKELADPVELAALCRVNGIRSLGLFGSRLHGDSRRDSDIDLLVEFEPGRRVTLLDMARIEIELTDLLDCPVDLRTAEELSPYFRQDVTAEARIIIAMRNRLIHAYFDVDVAVVLETTHRDLPPLIAAVEAVLATDTDAPTAP